MALLDLLAETGTVTSTQAANRLGYSSGLCSFHLRQLAKHGLVEEAPHSGGRHPAATGRLPRARRTAPARPEGTAAVAALTRLFPLPAENTGYTAGTPEADVRPKS
ncbi:helix-turn-helix transcriptional regulator [Streptomyces sp. SCSIO-PteL053]|nr:helix-turn-helix transcriptional regulator [Streptomyces sp. SCSIO-PteL053]